MKILLLGSGGREHALAWKIAQSSILDELFIAPGNASIQKKKKNVAISPTDFTAIKDFVLDNNIEMVVVGPEEPLVNGIYDFFKLEEKLRKVALIGPSKIGAQLEGSKDFAKAFMNRHSIPTAKYGTFTAETIEEGIKFLRNMKAPYVLKADGLAAGKGVLILKNLDEAELELRSMLEHQKFGKASAKVVIEQFLAGIELSVFVITDGDSFKLLPEAKDYKRIGEGDTGLNTGGMGAVSPVPFADAAFMDKVHNRIIVPTVKGLKAEGIDYKGFIFFGLISVKGDPYVIEYNCRMGDPETQPILIRLKSDLLALLLAATEPETSNLAKTELEWDRRVALGVVMAAHGYPGTVRKGDVIHGLKADKPDAMVFHAATAAQGTDIVTSGGRVLCVTALGDTVRQAQAHAYELVDAIHFDGAQVRRDIGHRGVKR